MATTPILQRPARPPLRRSHAPASAPPEGRGASCPAPNRMASNFAALTLAEIACRATSVAVTLSLTKRLGPAGFGKIEFAFNVVFWLVLLVRDGLEVIASREIARHPRLIRPLVNHILAVKGMLALALFAALMAVGSLTLTGATERTVLAGYGLMLLTTAMGLDFVYRGLESMGLVAASLCIRTAIYAVGVAFWVTDPSRLVLVPACLVAGEACGIALIWACYARRFGWPRPQLGGQALRVFLRRGKPVYLIQVSQAVIGSADLLVIGLTSRWVDVGVYSAAHRMAMVVLTFGLIVQQVIFPALSRSWRQTPDAGRRALDASVRFLVLGLIPLAVGATILAGPLVRYLGRSDDYAGAALLLSLGIWRAPLLTIAYLYQTALIALNRESAGVRLLVTGAIASAPLVAALRWGFGLPGASAAVVAIGAGLLILGHRQLARSGRQPAWHHHVARPLLASLAMVPACLLLARVNILLAIAGGALTYIPALIALGGLRRDDLRAICGRPQIEGPGTFGD